MVQLIEFVVQLIKFDITIDHVHHGVVLGDDVREVNLSGVLLLDLVPQFPELYEVAARVGLLVLAGCLVEVVKIAHGLGVGQDRDREGFHLLGGPMHRQRVQRRLGGDREIAEVPVLALALGLLDERKFPLVERRAQLRTLVERPRPRKVTLGHIGPATTRNAGRVP
jgi:hypothetical protein